MDGAARGPRRPPRRRADGHTAGVDRFRNGRRHRPPHRPPVGRRDHRRRRRPARLPAVTGELGDGRGHHDGVEDRSPAEHHLGGRRRLQPPWAGRVVASGSGVERRQRHPFDLGQQRPARRPRTHRVDRTARPGCVPIHRPRRALPVRRPRVRALVRRGRHLPRRPVQGRTGGGGLRRALGMRAAGRARLRSAEVRRDHRGSHPIPSVDAAASRRPAGPRPCPGGARLGIRGGHRGVGVRPRRGSGRGGRVGHLALP
jgi:hypothetical protein